ncbi:DNA topoisomerase 3-alpha [Fusarium sporotrichioides]|uniref:DNA topoisomerase 3-alpha n=1 Tax=Fusarium sporotrichioides TaxID=5514 RepID=A0A395RQ27_FUSSP|nr:DNA topoisomerase 3-alpha [Fusarium sporotrichioides]
MPSTPRFKRQRDPQTPKSQKKRLPKGRYSDGNWWCNCEPRQKATLREVKKTGPNNGKLFWKCDDCNFFLWRDEAKTRENGLKTPRKGDESSRAAPPPMTQQSLVTYGYQVTPNRRQSDEYSADSTESGEDSEPDTPMPRSARNRTQTSGSSKSSTLSSAAAETPTRGPAKRRRDIFEEDEEEFSDPGSDEERQMAAIADKSAEKAAQKRYTTPSTSRSTDVISGLPTPSVSRTLFPTSESKRQKQVSFDESPLRYTNTLSSATVSANTTPSKTPSRQQGIPPSSPPETDYDVMDEVIGLLRGQKVDPKTLSSVQNILATAARRTKGIVLGRDTARASLKAKDEKITTLQERIAALENREKMHRKQMTDIKAGLMKMYDDN